MMDFPIRAIAPNAYAPVDTPEGCGEEVEAKEEWQTLEYKLDGSNAAGEPDGFKRCNSWIKAPSDRKVEVEIVALPDMYVDSGCKYAGLEIKAHTDKRLTGYRFCSKKDINKRLISNTSFVPVITYNRLQRSVNTKLKYHYV
ncbi:hypothetical protein TELCIR_14479 [Teladorsagia circumcincta]|uniref:CUB domain-containing protein n=1 Tax=Teladorsagia circumcincta TaxID=45464 RepID=A0A2G9U0Y2_TELCI|nr:hypothetical protein TELCIR_14479 [Teladorsagia circumcincta]